MKKLPKQPRTIIGLYCFFLLLTTSVFSQVPQKMSYQAVIRDHHQELVMNKEISMRLSILQGTANGAAVYMEMQHPVTNANGLVSLELGAGTILSGNMEDIHWEEGPYYIQTETALSGGDIFDISSTRQILSVPYALYAGECGTPGPPGEDGVGIDYIGDNEDGTLTIYYTDGTSFTTPDFTGPQGEPGTTLWLDGNGQVSTAAKVGIGTDNPAALLHAHVNGSDEGSVVFTGAYSSSPGPVPVSGAGTRMLWYPDKAAFRAGSVSDAHWNTNFVGPYSAALGRDAVASGHYSISLGFNARAEGFAATTFGRDTKASGSYAMATGYNTLASGFASTAMGYETLAEANYSTAVGYQTNAMGNFSTATGYKTYAGGLYSTALGRQTYAQETYATAIGGFSWANGFASTAMGYNARATGNYAFAINLDSSVGWDVQAHRFMITGATVIGGNVPWSAFSDRKLKKEIQPLDAESNLDKILQLNGARFRWMKHDEWFNLGFIAQDVQDIIPESVRYDESNDIFLMEYSAIIPVLVEAMKEQQTIIEDQQNTILQLKRRITALEE